MRYLLQEISARIKPYPDIHLVPFGAWNKTGPVTFYHAGFSGASSFFPFNLETMERWSKLSREELLNPKTGTCKMTPITVNAIRMDEWMEETGLQKIDLLCMDVQGAALNIFEGLGKYLQRIKYIICEVDYQEIYEGEKVFDEIKDFMTKRGFACYFDLDNSNYFNDVLFINQNL